MPAATSREENNFATGQITPVEIIVLALRQLPQAAAVGPNFPDLPAPVVVLADGLFQQDKPVDLDIFRQ